MSGAVWAYLAAANVLAFSLMGADKRRARTGRWRIPERALFAAALLGGGAGATAGMWLFRHKTRKAYFAVGFPVIFLLQALPAVWLLWPR